LYIKKIKPLALLLEADLKDIKGVSKVNKIGYLENEVQIELSPYKMRRYYISFEEVINSIKSRNIRSSGGTIDSYIGRKSIVTLSKFKKPLDVKDVILRSNFDLQNVRLSDVAKVSLAEKDSGIMVRNNGKKGISITVAKKETADIINVVDAVKKYMQTVNLPKGVKVSFINDKSKRTRARIGILLDNGLMGFILVFLILLLFLNLKTAFWTAFGIPFSMLGVFLILPFFGITINNISLAAFIIVIGMLVDDAIVVAEHIENYKESGMSPAKAAIKGASEMVMPVMGGVLTTIAAFIPMFFMGGVPGKFVSAIPIVVTITLLFSLFESFLLLPGHVAHESKEKKVKKTKVKAKWIIKLEDWYEKVLIKVMKKDRLFLIGIILLLVFTLGYTFRNVGFVMFSSKGTEKFTITYETPVGSSIEKTEREVIKVEKKIIALKKRFGEIESFSSVNGSHENKASTTVYLTPSGKRSRSARQIMASLRKSFGNMGKTIINFQAKKMGPPNPGKAAEIMVIGNNKKNRELVIKRVMKIMKSIPGLQDVEREDKKGKKELRIQINYKKLAAYGLTTESVASIIRLAFDGQEVSYIQTIDEKLYYRVILAKKYRRKTSSIKFLQVRNSTGRLINVNELISFKTVNSIQQYYHYNGKRAVSVSADVKNKIISPMKATRIVKQKLLKNFKIPPGIRIQIEGESKETKKMMADMGIALVFAVAAIFFIIALVLDSTKKTLMILSSVPFGMIGVIWGLKLHGMSLSMFSLMGVLALVGIIVNDSIVMVTRLSKKLKDDDTSIANIASIAKTRLRAVILTTLTTALGLLPTAFGLGGSDPMIQPLAVTMSYGLLFATVITLFLIPSRYYSYQKKLQKKKTKRLAQA
jgi:multidrug efflux pump subunit AcrB